MTDLPQGTTAAARILVIEDDESIAAALEFILGREGHGCTWFRDAQGVLERMQGAPADLVVLDAMLPGISGFELCRQLRAVPGLTGTRILMMSANGPTAAQRCLDSGADAFVSKPFEMNHLRAEVRRLLAAPAA